MVSLANPKDELRSWLQNWVEDQLDSETFNCIYDTLKANHFSTRLKLKLITAEQLKLMFEAILPLGTRALLDYQLQVLRDESPLPSKVNKQNPASYSTTNNSPTAPKRNTVQALKLQEEKLKEQLRREKNNLKEIEMNIESMAIHVPKRIAIGNGRTLCGHCHHRGHRNQALNPCILKKCTDYTYCSIKDKHPEYFAKLSSLKMDKKKKLNAITEIETQVKTMEQFSSSSEHQFIKSLMPRMIEVDASYKLNKAKLMRDVRLLRNYFDGKIPPKTTNDPEQLKILISKIKKSKKVQADSDIEIESLQSSPQKLSPVKRAPCTSCSKEFSCQYKSDSYKFPKPEKTRGSLKFTKSSTSGSETDSTQSSDDGRRRKQRKVKKKLKVKSKVKKSSQFYDSSDEENYNTPLQKNSVSPYFPAQSFFMPWPGVASQFSQFGPSFGYVPGTCAVSGAYAYGMNNTPPPFNFISGSNVITASRNGTDNTSFTGTVSEAQSQELSMNEAEDEAVNVLLQLSKNN